MFFAPAAQVDMAGQLMVHSYEAHTIRLAEPLPGFLNLRFEDAISEFRRRGILDEDELAALIGDYREMGAKARRLLLRQLQERTTAALERALQDGGTLADFAERVAEGADEIGIGQLQHGYLENVFRTNVMTAYGAGRERAITHPFVQQARPYWQYRTADDGVAPIGRVRANHQANHLKVFQTGNSVTDKLRPPNGFSCRCSAVTLDADEARAEGEVWNTVPPGGEPDPGFNQTPTAMLRAPLEED